MAQETKGRKKGPHDGHKKRMRKRFLQNKGFTGFSDHEILEVLLNYANVQKNTNEIAHELISKFGSLENVFEAEVDELMQIHGVGERTATLICMQRELFRVYGQRRFDVSNKKPRLKDDDYIQTDFFQYVSTLYAGVHTELFYMICINARGRMSKAKLICEGSSDCVIINQRKILKEAINNDAKSVIFVHNHITGIALPSNADVENTIKIRACLEAAGIELADHFVYTDKGCVSILKDARYKYRK